MKVSKLLRFSSLFFAMLVLRTGTASGDSRLLNLLVQKGILTESEASAVSEELEEETPGTTFSAKGKETVKLRLSGRIHFQYDHLDLDSNSGDAASANHFYLRRLRFGAKADLKNGLFAETVVNFAENDLSVEKGTVGYKFHDAFTGILGYQKVPFGFQETTSSSKIKTIERSATNRFFANDIDFSGRHTGLHAEGSIGGGFSYAAAAVNGAQGEGSRLLGDAESDNDMAVFTRVRWENDALTVGVDAGHQSNNNVVSGNNVDALTAYVNYQFEGWDILGEYFTADMDAGGDAEGYAIRLAYRIDDFEPVLRYSYLKNDRQTIDSDELIRRAPRGGGLSDVTGGDNEIDSYYVGVNYYYNKAVSLMLGYEMAETDSDSDDELDIEGFRSRLQILW